MLALSTVLPTVDRLVAPEPKEAWLTVNVVERVDVSCHHTVYDGCGLRHGETFGDWGHQEGRKEGRKEGGTAYYGHMEGMRCLLGVPRCQMKCLLDDLDGALNLQEIKQRPCGLPPFFLHF